jgi:hypothetical protein
MVSRRTRDGKGGVNDPRHHCINGVDARARRKIRRVARVLIHIRIAVDLETAATVRIVNGIDMLLRMDAQELLVRGGDRFDRYESVYKVSIVPNL